MSCYKSKNSKTQHQKQGFESCGHFAKAQYDRVRALLFCINYRQVIINLQSCKLILQ